MGRKIWITANTPENIYNRLMREFHFPRPIAMFLANRDVKPENVDAYLKAPLRELSDPYRFPDIKKAVARLWKAILNRERILIHGDYDTDGVTATVLLEWVLRDNGAIVSTFLPDRFDDGYGFTPDSLEKALAEAASECNVLVTVDCGVTSMDAVEKAKSFNVDIIVTDHHEPSDVKPDAFALINPKLEPSLKDLHSLSGVGVAFKLSHAFIKYGRENNLGGFNTKLNDVLDLVALGTIADIVPLLGENRILVKQGVKILKKQIRPGIRALIEVANIGTKLKPSDITYKLAPRINAAGRLGNANIALSLLNSNNIVKTYQHANLLEEYNVKRQNKEEEIYQEAKRQICENLDISQCLSILVAGENWHEGVIGIVASRLTREYNRPAVVLTIQGDEAHGSGRSIGNLNMVEALSQCSHLLNRYGGHPMAVGLGLDSANIKEFYIKFEDVIKQYLTLDDLVDHMEVDGIVQLSELDEAFFHYLRMLEPFGHGNPQPLFKFEQVEPIRVLPAGAKHSRGTIQDIHGKQFDFIAFNHPVNVLPQNNWDLVATPQINEFRGDAKQQLQIHDLRPSF